MTATETGIYSELIAAAAFIAEGRQVAMPPVNQAGWDLLVHRSGCEWDRVQVKTARMDTVLSAPSCQMRRTYTSDDVDVIVLVFPPTGTIWKYPISEVSGVDSIKATNEFLWVGTHDACGERMAMPVLSPPIPLDQERQKRGASFKLTLRMAMPSSRPENVTEETWEMLCEWISGHGYLTIGKRRGIHGSSVRERIVGAAKKILGRGPAQPRSPKKVEAKRTMPVMRPDYITEQNWDVLGKWVDGHGYGAIGRQYGVSGSAIKERIKRTLHAIESHMAHVNS